MATLDEVAAQHYAYQAALIGAIEQRALALWSNMSVEDIDKSWAAIEQQILTIVAAGQYTAAAAADNYVQAALQTQGVTQWSPYAVDPRTFAGIASDGRDLAGLLLSAPLTVKQFVGAFGQQALTAGAANLLLHVGTQLADAGRSADQTAMVAHPHARRWVRQIEYGACSRCAILAGRSYRWNADFSRHPRCRCRAIPLAEDSGDRTTDPHRYFNSLTRDMQDRLFTKAGAQAIRDGADIGQVVNARRGMTTATMYGRQLKLTREGVTRRGIAGQRELIQRNGGVRLMPEQIYRDAKDRDDAIRLLRSHGYVTTRETSARAPGGAGGGRPSVQPPGGSPPPATPPGPGSGAPPAPPRQLAHTAAGDFPMVGDLVPTTLPTTAEYQAIKKDLVAILERQFGPVELVDLDIPHIAKDELRWTAHFKDSNGTFAGTTTRTFFRQGGRLIVHHDLLELEHAFQGQGIAAEFYTFLEDWYWASNVDQLELLAGLDGGGYAWALRGFQWADEVGARGVEARLQRAITAGVGTPAELASAQAVLDRFQNLPFTDPAFPLPADVALIGRGRGVSDFFGKRVMRGSWWDGVKFRP